LALWSNPRYLVMVLRRNHLALLLLCGATAAQAQESTMRGLTIGAGLGPGLVAAGGDHGWGSGASARIAYGVSEVVQIFAQAHHVTAETDGFEVGGSWRLWSLSAGLRLHLFVGGAWTPYLDIAGARRTGSIEAVGPFGGAPRDWDLDGEGVAVGAGVLFRVREALAVDAGATMTRGWLPNPRDDDPVFTHSGALAVGVSWWP
jgi:hypothetical protein